MSHYPIDDTALLIYQLTSSLQYRESSFTVPVVKDGKLVGLLMRYDATHTECSDVIPSAGDPAFPQPAAAKKEYRGFPRAGVLFAPMRDPLVRRYAGLEEQRDARRRLYFPEVVKHGPGDNAGLQVGDVLLAIGDKAIDQDGDNVDPQYGKISLVIPRLPPRELRWRRREIQNLPQREKPRMSMSRSHTVPQKDYR